MLVVEGIPFNSFKERLQIMKSLNDKRNIQVLDNCIYMEHIEKKPKKIDKAPEVPVIKAEETDMSLKEFVKSKMSKYEKRVKNRQALYKKKRK